jgi:L-2,4-diaminobutyrate decarboxylase
MDTLLKQAYSPELFRSQAQDLVNQLADYLKSAQTRNLENTIPYRSPETNWQRWQADFETGTGDVAQLFRDIIQESTHLHHPRYMGHQVSPPLPLAALAGMLTELLNNGMAVYEMGLVSNPLERITSQVLAKRIGYGDKASGLLTSGGTLANLTALLAARASKAPTDVWEVGNQERLAVMVSEEAHYCVDRAARIMGLGSAGIIKVPVNARFQMRTDLLEEYLQRAQNEGLTVIAVVGSACSTSTGSYDDLEAIADFCERHQLWFHADGAHGGAVVFSEKYRHLVKGIDRADSVVIDWHKMLMVPALATALVFKRGEDAFKTFHQKAHYLWADQESEDWFNSGKRTFECTKLMMSVKIYALMKAYGEAIFTENVDVLYDLGSTFARMLATNPSFELAIEPESNIVCFRYVKGIVDMPATNRINAQIRQFLLEDGRFYIVQTTLHEQVFLRVSLMNPLTTLNDLAELLAEIEKVGAELLNHTEVETV